MAGVEMIRKKAVYSLIISIIGLVGLSWQMSNLVSAANSAQLNNGQMAIANQLQKGQLTVGKSQLWYMVGPNLANDQRLSMMPNTPLYGSRGITTSYLAGRNNFNLWAPNNHGTYERWISVHNDSPTQGLQGNPLDGAGSSQLLIGSLSENDIGNGAIGQHPDGDYQGNQVATQSHLSLDETGILREELTYQYKIEDHIATFSDVVQFIPTAWNSVIVKEQITNQSHRDLPGIFFGRAIDTDMRPFDTQAYGESAIGDKVAIKYLGNQRGLYEDQVIPAQGNRPNYNGTPANYPGGAARLSYQFKMHDGTGPDAWRALDYSGSVIKGGTFITGAFRNAINDYGQARNNGVQGETAFNNGDTMIAMMWFAKNMPSGSTRTLSYEVGINGQGQYKSPLMTLDQIPTVDYNGRTVQLSGTVTDFDNPNQPEQLKYQIIHQDGTQSTAKTLTTVTNQAGQAVHYQATLTRQTDALALGDWIYVWAVDADGNPSVNHELTILVTPQASATSQVKNETTDGAYAEQIAAKVGDQINYQTVVQMTPQATADLAAGAVVEQALPAALKSDTQQVRLDYYDAQHQFMGQQITTALNNRVTTNQTVPIGGKLVLNYQAKVIKDDPAKAVMTTKVTGGGLRNPLIANETTVKIAKNLTLTSPIQTVTNLTAKHATSDRQINGQVGDRIRFNFQTKVAGQNDGSGLQSIHLEIHENDNQYTDRAGQLGPVIGQAEYQRNQTGPWQPVTSAQPTNEGTLIKLVLPTQAALKAGDQINIRYTKAISTAPAKQQYLYNDGTVTAYPTDRESIIGPVKANAVRIKANDQHRLTIRYVDLDANLTQPTLIAATETALGTNGQLLSEQLPGRISPKLIDGYTITGMTTDTDLDKAQWTAPYQADLRFEMTDQTVTYGYHKAMIAIAAPNDWDFGDYQTASTDSIYYLKTANHQPQQVSIVDFYGVENWQLTVQQAEQFKDDKGHTLTGAQLQVDHGQALAQVSNSGEGQLTAQRTFQLKPGDEAQTIMTFTKKGPFQRPSGEPDHSSVQQPYQNPGQGSWQYQFGTPQSANYSVGLKVPATTKRHATRYQTELTWSLTVAP